MKKLYAWLVAAFASLLAVPAFAVPPDFSTLTGAVDYSTATTAIMTVFGALGVVYIVLAGGRLILNQMRRG